MFRILIVDDNYTSRSQIKALFGQYGDCDTAPDGEIAYQLFLAAHKENIPYDIITMDIDMPNVKGDQIVNKMRKWEQENAVYKSGAGKEAAIIMVTALSMKDNIMSSFKSGCEAYIVKPITKDKVSKIIDEIKLQKC
ncbi:MAG: response regulator [Sedimentisphaerales bacterium]|nr:response regulator [Sedimentisphaerales bacterium]